MEISEFILSEMKQRDMSMREFARFVGVSPTTISNTLNTQKQTIPSIEFLAKLAEATHTDITVIVSMVFPELTGMDSEVMWLALRISQLPKERQKMIRQYLIGRVIDDRFDSDNTDVSEE